MNTKELWVVVARLQWHAIHPWQKKIIDEVSQVSNHLLLCLGVSPLDTKSPNNPLPYESRKQMVEETYVDGWSSISVEPIKDVLGNDQQWSKNLDDIIRKYADNYNKVRLYGSRDSFIRYYTGEYECVELDQYGEHSGTALRQEIAQTPPMNEQQRIGAIWASQQPYSTVYSTVDVAIFNTDFSQIRLARKEHEDKYRFVGWFVDPTDPDRQYAAHRELWEETGIAVDGVKALKHVWSKRIDDPRYRGSWHTIMTDLFYVQQQRWGRPQDDIKELQWFDYPTLTKEALMPVHHELFDLLTEKVPQTR
jgi:bifunctional NMN adenylyltransferase/nudix hydrolase